MLTTVAVVILSYTLTSSSGYADASWSKVAVPHDWRQPPTNYGKSNATGWYRRNFTLSAKMMAAYV